MARYRLRFLLQEFDLVGPEVMIGRSPDCQITIEDPLISRQHARLDVEPAGVTLVDLGSRNGTRLNGRPVKGSARLKDGDRIRVGVQELVFHSGDASARRAARETGSLHTCGSCHIAYPDGAPACPHCGAPTRPDEETFSGVFVEPRRSFTFALLGDVIERAIVSGKTREADRVLRRASQELDESLASGESLDPQQIASISCHAVRLAAVTRDVEWLAWTLDLYRRAGRAPAASVMEQLVSLDLDGFATAKPVLRHLAEHSRHCVDKLGARAPSEERDAANRLEQLARRL